MRPARLLILCVLLLVPCGLLRAQWYEEYQSGKDALARQQWQSAVTHFTKAIEDESDSKAGKRTYGLSFIDYFPYLYRGIALYHLGDLAAAKADLDKARGEGAIADAQRDEEAGKLLDQYAALVAKPSQQVAQKKQEQNPPEAAKQNPPSQSQGVKTAEKQKPAVQPPPLVAKNEPKSEPKNEPKSEPKKEIAPPQENRRPAEQKKSETAPGTAAESRVPPAVNRPTGADTAGTGLFTQGAALYASGNVVHAKYAFELLRQRAPSYPGLADYLGMIEGVEQRTSAGIAAYFQGEYREAIDQLKSSSRNGSDNPHLYAVLACAYAAEYLLAGEENGALKQEAVDAYGHTRGLDPRYELDSKLISPRIIAILTGR